MGFVSITIIVITTAVLLSVYNHQIIQMKSKKKDKIEDFNESDLVVEKQVRELLDREATTYEKKLYYDLKSDEIREAIMKTREYQQKNGIVQETLIEGFTNDDDTTLENYRKIINVYNKVLNRMPSKFELEFYENKRKQDPSFCSRDLEKILESSREYYIMQKNQTNQVNAELPGNITDKQITMRILEIYKSVYGSQSTPSDYFEDFMKKKYVEYKLDNDRLKKLLLFMKDVDNNTNTSCTNIINNESKSKTEEKEKQDTNLNIKVNTLKPSGHFDQSSNQTNNQTQKINDSKPINQSQQRDENKPINQIQQKDDKQKDDMMSTCKRSHDDYVFNLTTQYSKYPYDEQYHILSKLNNGKTGIPKKCSYSDRQFRDLYAEEVNKRNQYEVQYACERNKYFSNEIENGILSSNNNSTIGTPLYEALDTKIGSILPKFEYKNLV